MSDASDIRRANVGSVLRVLWRGEAKTKEEVAREAGLSLPTANTLLNALAASGEVEARKRPSGRAGRTALDYRVNEARGTVLTVSFEVDGCGERRYRLDVLSVLGNVRASHGGRCERLSYETLLGAVRAVLDEGHDVRQIVLGVPAVVRDGVLSHCDAVELDGTELVSRLARDTGLPVHAENDMHHKAYGCYRMMGSGAGIVTLANFPVGVLPGTATVANGRVLKGAHRFAGMIGFLEYGMPREAYRERMRRPTARPLIAQGLCAMICAVDPDLIVCTGDLVDGRELDEIAALCSARIPAAYLPRFAYRESMDDVYLAGMLGCALDARLEGGEA